MSTNPDHPPDEDRVLAVRDRAQVAIQKVNDDLNAGRIGEAEWYRAVSADLAARARLHLPQWSDRIYVGNVIEWEPPRRFDFVRTGVEYVPPARRAELIIRILDRFLLPGGRLIVGPFRSGDPNVDPSVALEQTGHAASGEAESPTPDGTLPRRIIWIDAAAC